MPEIIVYMVRDPQGTTYGPALMETLRQWIREGRITAAMQLAPEGTVDWKPAAAYLELQDMFSPEVVFTITGQRPGSLPPPLPSTPPPTPGAPTNPYAAPMASHETPGLKRMNVLAVLSMISGILGVIMFCPFPCCECVGGIPLDIAAIVMGVLARGQIAKNADSQKGEGMAMAGIILGVIGLILALIGGVFFFARKGGGGPGFRTWR